MPVIFATGFDASQVVADQRFILNPADTAGYGYGSLTALTTGRRSGGNCLYRSASPTINFWAAWRPNPVVGRTTITTGLAFKFNTRPTSDTTLIQFRENTTNHVWVRYGVNTVTVGRGAAGTNLLYTSPTFTHAAGAWYYIEAKVVIHDTAGEILVKIDGTTLINQTGLDTRNAAVGEVNNVYLHGTGDGGWVGLYIDDWYITDGEFLGDVQIHPIRPSGVGSSADFTPLSGTNWESVDEAEPDGDTTYVGSGTVGHLDLYAMSDLPTSPTAIHGVTFIHQARRTDPVSRVIQPKVRSGGANYSVGGTHSLVDTFRHFATTPVLVDPATGVAWTESGVNGIELGQEVVS